MLHFFVHACTSSCRKDLHSSLPTLWMCWRVRTLWSSWWLCVGETKPRANYQSCELLRQGLAHLLDRVADHYSVSPLPHSKASNSTESDSDSGFVSPASVALPLARFLQIPAVMVDNSICISPRLLPILTVVLEEEDGEPWLHHLQV